MMMMMMMILNKEDLIEQGGGASVTPDRVAGAGLDPCRGNWALPLLALPSRLVSVLIYLFAKSQSQG